jgi:hypothetical protein
MQQEMTSKAVAGMGDIVFFIVRLFQGHYFSPLFLGLHLCPMIFCVRDAGKSDFLATDRRSQL